LASYIISEPELIMKVQQGEVPSSDADNLRYLLQDAVVVEYIWLALVTFHSPIVAKDVSSADSWRLAEKTGVVPVNVMILRQCHAVQAVSAPKSMDDKSLAPASLRVWCPKNVIPSILPLPVIVAEKVIAPSNGASKE